MEIEIINFARLRNEEHFQFHTELTAIVEAHTKAALGVEALWARYAAAYADEREALDVVRKSAATEELVDADGARDETFRGLSDVVRASTRHYDESARAAAHRLAVVLDGYGNVGRKPYDEQTAAVAALLDYLRGKGAADVATLGLAGWVAELAAQNEAFDALKKGRYTEAAGRTQLKMKDVREEIDEAYRAIARRIDALAVVNGETPYAGFVNELNARIATYGGALSKRQGRGAKVAAKSSAAG
jgi:hypothetical protein